MTLDELAKYAEEQANNSGAKDLDWYSEYNKAYMSKVKDLVRESKERMYSLEELKRAYEFGIKQELQVGSEYEEAFNEFLKTL